METGRDFLSAEELYVAGAGFIVGDHNFGRLDTLSRDELSHLGGHVERLAAEVERLQEGLKIAREIQLERDRAAIREKYDH